MDKKMLPQKKIKPWTKGEKLKSKILETSRTINERVIAKIKIIRLMTMKESYKTFYHLCLKEQEHRVWKFSG
jgi:hypothetical protein